MCRHSETKVVLNFSCRVDKDFNGYFLPCYKTCWWPTPFGLASKKNTLMLQGRRRAGFSQTSIFIDKITWRNFVDSSSVICQTTGPKPLPKRFHHIVRSRASSFNWQYPLLSLRSSSSFLRLLPRRRVTSICPFIFRSITYCRRQFLRKMWSSRIYMVSLFLERDYPGKVIMW